MSFGSLMAANWSRPVIILMLAVLIAMMGALLLVLSGRFCYKKRRPMCLNFFAQCECCCWSWHSKGLSCCYCESCDKKYSDRSQNATAQALSSEESDEWNSNSSPTEHQLSAEQQQLLVRQTSGESGMGATLSTSTMSSPRLATRPTTTSRRTSRRPSTRASTRRRWPAPRTAAASTTRV